MRQANTMEIDLSNLKRLQGNVRQLRGSNIVKISVLLGPVFMRRHTSFQSFQQMIDKSPFKITTTEDFAAVTDADWDEYVRQTTNFKSWSAMQNKATEEWASDRLMKGLK